MTKAGNLQRSDTFTMMLPMKVLSVEPLAGGLFKVKAETENSPSMESGGGGGDDIDPLPPSDLCIWGR
jgi:hypothetical protein